MNNVKKKNQESVYFLLILLLLHQLILQIKSLQIKEKYHAFKNSKENTFGLLNSENLPCLLLKMHAKIYNFNLNGTNIATELANFTSDLVKLEGSCAFYNKMRKKSQLQIIWKINKRKKTLKFYFCERYVHRSTTQLKELRWELCTVVYAETFKGKSIKFESNVNGSNIISAPLNQKFVCKDSLNITLKNYKYKSIILELLPEIDMQPVNTGAGYGSNSKKLNLVYLCDKTRRRTLKKSFENKITVFSGFVLGFSSVIVFLGHSFQRNLKMFKSIFN